MGHDVVVADLEQVAGPVHIDAEHLAVLAQGLDEPDGHAATRREPGLPPVGQALHLPGEQAPSLFPGDQQLDADDVAAYAPGMGPIAKGRTQRPDGPGDTDRDINTHTGKHGPHVVDGVHGAGPVHEAMEEPPALLHGAPQDMTVQHSVAVKGHDVLA